MIWTEVVELSSKALGQEVWVAPGETMAFAVTFLVGERWRVHYTPLDNASDMSTLRVVFTSKLDAQMWAEAINDAEQRSHAQVQAREAP